MSQFQEHEMVKLNHVLPESNLSKGSVGVVVMVYPESPQFYEVEFTDASGFTVSLQTLSEESLDKYEKDYR